MFAELKIGDLVSVRGPKGNFNYTPNMCKSIGMIAGTYRSVIGIREIFVVISKLPILGGTGITPMLQVN